MSDLFLIAHIVRGSPAFDIAAKIVVPDQSNGADEGAIEEIWIIPTSGHRAWPYWYIDLDELMPLELIGDDYYGRHKTVGEAFDEGDIRPPKGDWPDHYHTAVPTTHSGTDLAKTLGIGKSELVTRRI